MERDSCVRDRDSSRTVHGRQSIVRKEIEREVKEKKKKKLKADDISCVFGEAMCVPSHTLYCFVYREGELTIKEETVSNG